MRFFPPFFVGAFSVLVFWSVEERAWIAIPPLLLGIACFVSEWRRLS